MINVFRIVLALTRLTFFAHAFSQEAVAPIKKVAQISAYASSISALDSTNNELLLSETLLLLQSSCPNRTFCKSNSCEEPKTMKTSPNAGDVAGTVDYTMTKLRGSIVKNVSVKAAQCAQGMAAFDRAGALIKHAFEFERQQASRDNAGAVSYLKEVIIPATDALREQARTPGDGLKLAIRLVAI